MVSYSDLEDELLLTVLGVKGIENGWESISVELDWKRASVANLEGSTIVPNLHWIVRGQRRRGKEFSPTVNNGTNDLVDLASDGRISAGETSS